MHSVQPCRLGYDALLNMVLSSLLDNVWRGLPFVDPKFQEGLKVAPVVVVSGVATAGRMWAKSQEDLCCLGNVLQS